MRKKLSEFLNEKDILALTRRGEAKEVVSVRLTADARRLIDEECKKRGVKRGEALEYMLRELRELRKVK